MVSDGVATCPCMWTDSYPCAGCGRVPSDFYESDAEELAHEITMELFYFSQLRPRREAQAARLWENEEGWASNVWLAWNEKPYEETRPIYFPRLKRMQRKAGLRNSVRKC